jgi:FkbM family methyltransferase
MMPARALPPTTAKHVGGADVVKSARKLLGRLLTPAIRSRLVPLLRAYIRFMPGIVGKQRLWGSVIAPFFGWLPYKFDVRTRFGARMRGNTEDFIQRRLYYFGLWEPDLTRFLADRLRPGDVFVDIGANIGYFSLYAAKLVGSKGDVVAIEASPSIYTKLRENLALNGADNVRALNLAAASQAGTLSLYRGPADNQGGTTLVADGTSGATFECQVAAEPLTSIVTRQEWERARLVKVDVEGAEAAVAEGMAPLLANAREDLEIVMEIAPRMLARQGKRPQDILRMFEAAGFHAYRLENDYSSSAGSYLESVHQRRPLRITEPLTSQTDVVFSRIDSGDLPMSSRP